MLRMIRCFTTSNLKPSASVHVKALQLAAWKSPPTKAYTVPLQSKSDILKLINNALHLNADPKALPRLLPAKRIVVSPNSSTGNPEPKPNLLVATLNILDHSRRETRSLTRDSARESLCEYDIIMPRRPLRQILSGTHSWEVYAFRPAAGYPLYIDRVGSYRTTPNSIGMLFETASITKSTYHSVYSVVQGTLIANNGDMLVLGVTGEVDAFDDQCKPVEIKSRPLNRSPSYGRDTSIWIQCLFGQVGTIITGRFSQVGGRYGPATFEPGNITTQTISQLAQENPEKTKVLEHGQGVLRKIIQGCTKAGVVYHVSGNPSGKFMVQEYKHKFPICVETIENCISVMCDEGKEKL
jgi:hypothetical protein